MNILNYERFLLWWWVWERLPLKRKNATPLFRQTWPQLIEWQRSESPNWGDNELKHHSLKYTRYKVHGIKIRAWGRPYLLVPKPSWFGLAPPHWRPKARRTLWEVKHRPVLRFTCFQKFLWAEEELFSAVCSNKPGCWLSSPDQWTPNKICSRLMQQQPKPYHKQFSCV